MKTVPIHPETVETIVEREQGEAWAEVVLQRAAALTGPNGRPRLTPGELLTIRAAYELDHVLGTKVSAAAIAEHTGLRQQSVQTLLSTGRKKLRSHRPELLQSI